MGEADQVERLQGWLQVLFDGIFYPYIPYPLWWMETSSYAMCCYEVGVVESDSAMVVSLFRLMDSRNLREPIKVVKVCKGPRKEKHYGCFLSGENIPLLFERKGNIAAKI